LALGFGLPSLLAAWSGEGGTRARAIGLLAALLLGVAVAQIVARRFRPGPRMVRFALLAAGAGLPLAAALGAREWPGHGVGDLAGLTAGLGGGAIAAAPLWVGLGIATARLRPNRHALLGGLGGALVATPLELPVTVLPLVSAGLIFVGLIVARQLELRLDRRLSSRPLHSIVSGLVSTSVGALAVAAPALLAPQGLSAPLADPLIAAAICTLGLGGSAHARPE